MGNDVDRNSAGPTYYPASVIFSGVVSGDMECFCWDGVPNSECKSIRDDPDLIENAPELREMGGRLYPGDVMRHLGCEQGKRYRFAITVEEAG